MRRRQQRRALTSATSGYPPTPAPCVKQKTQINRNLDENVPATQPAIISARRCRPPSRPPNRGPRPWPWTVVTMAASRRGRINRSPLNPHLSRPAKDHRDCHARRTRSDRDPFAGNGGIEGLWNRRFLTGGSSCRKLEAQRGFAQIAAVELVFAVIRPFRRPAGVEHASFHSIEQ